MMRLIDADALIDKYQSECSVDVFRYEVIEDLRNAPTVDAVPVRHGKWLYDPNGMDWNLPAWVCSECHQKNDMIPTHIWGKDSMIRVTKPLRWAGSKFCPNCGARMDEE